MSNVFGLNKLARLVAKRKEEAVKNEPLPLNPDFPYEVIGFDAEFYGVSEWSDAPDAPPLTPDSV